MKHSQLVGIFLGYRVNDIKAEIELILIFEVYLLKHAVLVLNRLDKLRGNIFLRAGMGRDYRAADYVLLYVLAREHHGDKQAVPAVNRYHSVRG